MPDGKIKHYNHDSGSGMITPSNPQSDVFFNRFAVEGGDAWVAAGIEVTYDLADQPGTPQAKLVKQRP